MIVGHVAIETSFEPVTIAATFCSSFTFQSMIFFNIGVVDIHHHHLGSAACRSPGFDRTSGTVTNFQKRSSGRKTCRRQTEARFHLGCVEKLDPVPEPYLKSRASRTHRSMMPPSFTRSSPTALDETGVRLRDARMKMFDFVSLPDFKVDDNNAPEPVHRCHRPRCRPVLNHCGEFGAQRFWVANM